MKNNSRTISKKYAKSLFLVAKKLNQIENVNQDLDKIREIIKAPNFLNLLASPMMMEKSKLIITELANKYQFSKIVSNFCKLLCENKKIIILPQVIDLYEELMLNDKNILIVEIKTAIEITDEKLNDITSHLKKALSKELQIKHKVDKNILGGMNIKFGSLMIDLSLKNKLKKLEQLMKTSLSYN